MSKNTFPADSTRRRFMKNTAIGATGLAMATSATSYAGITGANQRVRLAVAGLKRRGMPLIRSIERIAGAEVSCVCEVDSVQLEKAMGEASKFLSSRPAVENDFRKVVERKDVDAVVLALPDHWHAYGTMIALQNGKHVYVEKPCGYNLAEDEILMEAEQKFPGLRIQMGSQQRSSPETRQVIEEIHNGLIGEAYRAVAFYSNGRGRVDNPQVMDPPATLDWDLWQGPAPRRPFWDILADYNWHWHWHWGTAESANNGTHELDIARWALQCRFPESVETVSGKHHFKDDGWSMYDTMYGTYRFPGNKVIHWEGNSRNNYKAYGAGRGTIIYGTEGSVFIDREHVRIYDRGGKLVRELRGAQEDGVSLGGGGALTDAHMGNFINAIRGDAELHAPMAEGAPSTHMAHYVNVASREGDARLMVDPQTGHFTDPAIMDRYWGRTYEPGWELS